PAPLPPLFPYTTLFRSAVAGEDRNTVAVVVLGRKPHRFFVILGAHHREDGAENLLLVDAHLRRDAVEQRAAHEETILVPLHSKADRKSTRLNSSHLGIS